MNAIHATKKLNERELELIITPEASWHRDYDDTAFIFIGGLPLDLSEGDVITMMSQYGEPVFINLVRDKETGKSKGFCYLKYEDQRSCTLAVDNLGGATVMGRMLRVDHTRYKKRDDEEIYDNTMGGHKNGQDEADTEQDSQDEVVTWPMLREEQELARLLQDEEDDDPMKSYLIEQKREEVALARAKLERKEQKDKKHRSHRSGRHGEERSERRRRDTSGDGRGPRKRQDVDRDDEDRDRRDRHKSHDDLHRDRRERRRLEEGSKDERGESTRHRHRERSPRRERDRDREREKLRREPSKTPVYGD